MLCTELAVAVEFVVVAAKNYVVELVVVVELMAGVVEVVLHIEFVFALDIAQAVVVADSLNIYVR